ncbi:DNA-binding response regulator [Arcanobacterium haemolyticum]|uniref:Two component transcriptional regulator, LuxR family n=1 Tax=Arcanobacterium haemolyticum (strain ATCC 9345 / DSM 20595 / CCM 5947 / CCUG 17215 / LMG 16163 / NBRC 15585 / NCTC 8452 / 11018) TaxID=644284 RepID=D7BMX0_ARCHD|nr:response regulator transcription factor [Arcanobacterium haemolyticum]ADH92269.1 two component transcriptional regulator, LuxR family [Arcanobacterium haemolyticum DSM 20595]QCX46406.1 DNA-binding response regulator [Arcanobacterium haemolyticum]SQH29012.1 Nitrogen regulation protein C [Arcanobacterium haemolyticum]
MTESLRIVIADDDAIVRSGLANLLNHQDGISVVATAANGSEALTAISRAQPDVALIDVDMPILDGISTAKILSQEYPRIAIVMLTAFEHEESLAKSLAANARGFLTKDIPAAQLAELIKQAHAGMNVISPRPTQILAEAYIKAQANQEKYQDFIDTIEHLPRYLRAVFNLVIKAKPNKTIAKELNITEATTRAYISELFTATGFTNRGELTITALKAGY